VREVQTAATGLVANVMAGRSVLEQALTTGAGAGPLLREITMGTLRHLGTLRAVGAVLARRPFDDRRLEALLCVAMYQLMHTRAAAHAVVHEAVGTARHIGLDRAAGFVNAALRRFLRERNSLIAMAQASVEGLWNHPAWWVERLRRDFPDAAEAVLRVAQDHPPMALRVNIRRTTVADTLERLAAEGIEARQAGPQGILLAQARPTRALPGFDEGLVSVQDLGAQWAAPLLDLHDGMRVLDACAAPGGKTAHILESADVTVTALDADEQRLGSVARNLDRLGLGAELHCVRAEKVGNWWDGRRYERILLDAPCSASGIVRRHPDARWLRRPTDVAAFARQQAKLLEALWQVLAPGGKLLYVTCSVFAEENADVVRDWLVRTPDAHTLELPGFPGAGGVLLPGSEHDGFFYALLQRR
jgi:16S rRNA (cytosine967-C5)-methyltransferase